MNFNRYKKTYMTLFFTALLFLHGCFLGEQDAPSSKKVRSCKTFLDCTNDNGCWAGRCMSKDFFEVHLEMSAQKIQLFESITIDLSQSQTETGEPLRLSWSLQTPSGKKQALDHESEMKIKLTPKMLGKYTLTYVLIAEKSQIQTIQQASFQVKQPDNYPPIALISPDQRVHLGDVVEIDGSKSYDPEGDFKKLTYLWSLLKKPKQSKTNIMHSNGSKSSLLVDVAGIYKVSLSVLDEKNTRSKKSVITVIHAKDEGNGTDKFKERPKLLQLSSPKAKPSKMLVLRLKGENFQVGAKVAIGIRVFKSQFISSQELVLKIDTSSWHPKQYQVQVTNPDQQSSDPLSFTLYLDKWPLLQRINPSKGEQGKTISLQVYGKDFEKSTEISFQGKLLFTKWISSSQLQANLDLRNIKLGQYQVSLHDKGKYLTEAKGFKVTSIPQPPTKSSPQINSLNPEKEIEKNKVSLGIYGSGFEVGAKIFFDKKELKTKRIRRDYLVVNTPLDLSLYKPGSYSVFVQNPDKSQSNREHFIVSPSISTPSIQKFYPQNLLLFHESEIRIYGKGFRKGAFLQFGSRSFPTIFKSSTMLIAKVDARKGLKVGQHQFFVKNPSGKVSKQHTISLLMPTPTIIKISRSSWSHSCKTTIEITGKEIHPITKISIESHIFQFGKTNKYEMILQSPYHISLTIKKPIVSTGFNTLRLINNTKSSRKLYVNVSKNGTLKPSSIGSFSIGHAESEISTNITLYSKQYESFKSSNRIYLGSKEMHSKCGNSSCSFLLVSLDLSEVKPKVHQLQIRSACGTVGDSFPFWVGARKSIHVTATDLKYFQVNKLSKVTINGKFFGQKDRLFIDGKERDFKYESRWKITTKDPILFKNPGIKEIYVQSKNGLKSEPIEISVGNGTFPITIKQIFPHKLEKNIKEPKRKVQIRGQSFSSKAKLFINNIQHKFEFKKESGFVQATITIEDINTMKKGLYHIHFSEGAKVSNRIPFRVQTPIPFDIRLPQITHQMGDKQLLKYLIRGESLCYIEESGKCAQTPQVIMKDSKGNHLSQRIKVLQGSDNRLQMSLNVRHLYPGDYTFQISQGKQQESLPVYWRILPPPQPIIKNVSPTWVYRGNKFQQVVIKGKNFIASDVLIFNNEVQKRLPLQISNGQTTSASVWLDLSRIKYAGKYKMRVQRCLDPACKLKQYSNHYELEVRDPTCGKNAGFSCSTRLEPNASEGCVPSKNICRPICKTDTECLQLPHAPKTATCVSGFCQ